MFYLSQAKKKPTVPVPVLSSLYKILAARPIITGAFPEASKPGELTSMHYGCDDNFDMYPCF